MLLEVGELGSFAKEVLVRPVQIFEGMLQSVHRGFFEPWGLSARWRGLTRTPGGQLLGKGLVGEVFAPSSPGRLLQAQRFVEDEAACARKAAHLPALLPAGHQLEAKSLLDEQAVILSSTNGNFKENRLDGVAVGAILPPLNGEVCRAC